MWVILREWLLLNTALNGPEDTRRKVRAVGSATGKAPGLLASVVRLVLWLTWWGIILLCTIAGVVGVVQGQSERLLGAAFLMAVLLVLRAAWRWFGRHVAAADDAAARARARRAGAWHE
jgi:hypothetical protein